MYFTRNSAAAAIAVAVSGMSHGSLAFTISPQQSAAKRTSTLSAQTLMHFMDEAVEAVGEMKKTVQQAELMEIETLREQARMLEEEALALEQQALALEEEGGKVLQREAHLELKAEITSVQDEATPPDASPAMEASAQPENDSDFELKTEVTSVQDEATPPDASPPMEASAQPENDSDLEMKAEVASVQDEATPPDESPAMEASAQPDNDSDLEMKAEVASMHDEATPPEASPAMEAPENDSLKSQVEVAPQPVQSLGSDSQQIQDGIQNRAPRRMSLRERLSQIDAKTSTSGEEVPVPQVVAENENNRDRREEPETGPVARTASLRDLLSSR